MKTMLTGMGLLILAVLVMAFGIWFVIRFMRWFCVRLIRSRELRKAWRPNQKIELALRWEMKDDLFHLIVRKKRWRLFKRAGWKYVNIYAGGDFSLMPVQDPDPEFNWIHVTWVPGTFNQFREDEILNTLLHTYGDLAAYYDLRLDKYKIDKKNFSFKDIMKELNNQEDSDI